MYGMFADPGWLQAYWADYGAPVTGGGYDRFGEQFAGMSNQLGPHLQTMYNYQYADPGAIGEQGYQNALQNARSIWNQAQAQPAAAAASPAPGSPQMTPPMDWQPYQVSFGTPSGLFDNVRRGGLFGGGSLGPGVASRPNKLVG